MEEPVHAEALREVAAARRRGPGPPPEDVGLPVDTGVTVHRVDVPAPREARCGVRVGEGVMVVAHGVHGVPADVVVGPNVDGVLRLLQRQVAPRASAPRGPVAAGETTYDWVVRPDPSLAERATGRGLTGPVRPAGMGSAVRSGSPQIGSLWRFAPAPFSFFSFLVT